MHLIDLSVPLEHLAASEPMPAQIHHVRHEDHEDEGLEQMQRFFGVRPEDLVYSAGKGWAIEEIHAITHTGEYCQIEKLANLDQLPRPHGFFVSCLPVKIAWASAGWCRAVALVPKE
jgi:kynurenine formamidase